MTSRAQVLLQSMNEFYKNPDNAKVFKDIVVSTGKRDGNISLRKIEKFITNFSKKNNFSFTTSSGQSFPVHMKYKSTLDGYSKKLFDPFARYDKIEYEIPATGEKVTTTVGQLNFLRWAIKNDIVKYLLDNPGITKQ